MQEILSTLKQFETWYNRREAASLEESGLAADGLVVIGPGVRDWCAGAESVLAFFRSQWSAEKTCWGTLDLGLEKAAPRRHGDVAWVIAHGAVKATVPTEVRYAEAVAGARALLTTEAEPQAKLLEVAALTARLVSEADRGADYTWPLRFEAVLVRQGEAWRIRHLQFSFSVGGIPEHQLAASGQEAPFCQVGLTGQSGPEVDAVRAVLAEYAEGYRRRDPDTVTDFMDRLWGDDPYQSIVGTDPGELFYGPEATRKIIGNDWRYWGNVWFNVPEALITVHGDVAWLATRATVTMEFGMPKWGAGMIEYILGQEQFDDRRKAMLALTIATRSLHLAAGGTTHIWPMRITAVLVKEAGRWQFRQMQYSDAIDW
ncbi:MAG TPA: nuclear transport factor 2 family protein, partial [Symbiobacteriaceae bacterium]|nr:nuclear transport factor 2 family protein [Symbiobacteriaceae bacterium]